jgi:hypothetical protein
MEDVVSELLRPLDDRDRVRGERMARAARQGSDAVVRRRLAPKLVRRTRRHRRSAANASQVALAPQPL